MEKTKSYMKMKEEFLENLEGYESNNLTWMSLKKKYAPIINSKRALDKVNDIKDLVRLLEKRCVVGENRVDEFRSISEMLRPNQPDLIQVIVNHKVNFSRVLPTHCQHCSSEHSLQQNPASGNNNMPEDPGNHTFNTTRLLI